MAKSAHSPPVTLEDRIRNACLVIFLISATASALGAAYGSYFIGGGGNGLAIDDKRTGELTYVLLKTMSTIAEDQVLDRHGVKDFKAWLENHDHPGDAPKQAALLENLASKPGIKNICQIGLHAGHATVLFLIAAPATTVYTFDPLKLAYSERTISNIRRIFPKRFRYIMGTPADTLPWFKGQKVQCDIASVDGNATAALTDFVNAIKISRVGGLLMANEMSTDEPGYEKAWGELVKAGYIKDPVCDSHKQSGRKWCHATIASQAGSLDAKVIKPMVASFKLDEGVV